MLYTDFTALVTSAVGDLGAGMLVVLGSVVVLIVGMTLVRKGIKWAKFSIR